VLLCSVHASGQAPLPPPDSVEAPAPDDRREVPDVIAPDVLEPQLRPAPVVRIGADFTVGASDDVHAVLVVRGDARIAGHIRRDVVVIFGDADIAETASIDGSLTVIGGQARVRAGAMVRGDVFVLGGTMDAEPGFVPGNGHVVIDPTAIGVHVDGLVPWITTGLLWGRPIVPSLPWVWTIVGAFFLVYLALTLLLERPVRRCADVIAAKPVTVFVTGLLTLVLVGPLALLVAVTIVGVLVLPFAICALLFAWLIGRAGVTRWIGMSLVPEARDEEGRSSRAMATRSLLIGSVAIVLLYAVPVVGMLVWGMGGVMALGSAVTSFREGYRRENPSSPRSWRRRRAEMWAGASAPATPTPVASAQAASAPPAMYPAAGAAPVPPSTDMPVVDRGAAPETEPPVTPPFGSPGLFGSLREFPAASFRDRLAAFALDVVVVFIAGRALDLLYFPADRRFILLLVLYHVAFWATKGTTVGGIICQLRVIKVDGGKLGPGDALIRGIAGVLSAAVAGIGFLWMLKDPDRETWHDKIAGTQVIKVPRHYPV
jgi:uncharacterized RDD family membrane protein YckC